MQSTVCERVKNGERFVLGAKLILKIGFNDFRLRDDIQDDEDPADRQQDINGIQPHHAWFNVNEEMALANVVIINEISRGIFQSRMGNSSVLHLSPYHSLPLTHFSLCIFPCAFSLSIFSDNRTYK